MATFLAKISTWSSQLFFLIVLFQLPLFRIPCKTGTCTNPLQLTAVQLAAAEAVPPVVIKGLLYPGALVKNVLIDMKLPEWSDLLAEYNMSNFGAITLADLQRFEIIAGSYFAVAGAAVSLIKPGRMSMFGMLLIVWGLIKEGLFQKSSSMETVKIVGKVEASPALLLALVLAVLSVKYDFQKVQRLARPVVKPLKSSSKQKIK